MSGGKSNRPKGQNGGGRKPVPSETRKRIVELASQTPKVARNVIAREVGVAAATVSRIVAQELPDHTWTRGHEVKAAQEAKAADMKTRRQAIADGLLDDVSRIRAMFFEDVERKHFSVAMGESTYYSKPAPDELRNLFTAVGIGLDKHAMLVRFDADDRDMPAVDRWLAGLGVGGLGAGGTVVAA